MVERAIVSGVSLDSEAEVVVYRVAQEAITNALRHAGAECIRVTLRREGGTTVLCVEDDGGGTEGAEEGAGVRGMRERAVLVGGTLELAAAPGGGTSVTLRLP